MSSGFSYPQPIFTSPIYNPAFYLTLDASGYLTYDYAQTLYLDKNDYRLTYITGITPGAATQGIALVPGTNNDISGIGALSCSSLTVNGSSVSSPPAYVVGIAPGTAANNKALVLGSFGEIGTISSLTATNIYGTLQTGAQTNITSVGTLTNLTLSTGGTGLQIPNLKFWNATTLVYDNFNHSYYIGVSEGGCIAQQALVVDLNKDIGSIRNLSCTGTLTNGTEIKSPKLTTDSINAGTSGILNIVGTTLRINGSDLTATAAELNYLNITSPGTGQASKALVLDNLSALGSGIASFTSTKLFSSANTTCSISSGNILSSTSKISEFNLALLNPSDNVGATAGLSFLIDDSSAGATTPSANIVAERVASSFAVSDLLFQTRSVSTQAGALSTRLRIHGDGKISFSDTIGDQQWNFLKSASNCSMRFGSDLLLRDCITMTWNYTSAGSTSNFLSYNVYGTQYALTITAQDRIGIGTSTPAAGLDVSSYASVSMTGPLATGTSSAYTVNRAGTYTDSVSIYCRQALMVGVRGAYIGSDRRVKENISTIPPEDGVKFVRDINPKIYDLKGFDKRQVGYISQDMMRDYSALISLLPDPNMTIEAEGDVDGAFLSMSYERVPAFLHAALKSVLDRLDVQQKEIDELRAIIAE